MASMRFRIFEYLTVALIILIGTGVRSRNIDSRPLWADEAESSINALTILERGYPFYQYLGIPIYENTLITGWPESSEYEFKDLSYSDRGLAIYHGWLPLYSIAASLAAFGVTPDTSPHPSSFRQDLSEFKRRNVAARVPAIIFSILTMIFMYLAGRMLCGYDGGFAALILSAFHETFVSFGWQARYYSATLTFVACSCVAILLSIFKGRWRHFVFVGLTLVCLFHTHILSFLVALIVFVFSFFKWRRHRSAIPKCCLTFLIICVGTLPWIFFTGFLTSLGRMPRAWSILNLSLDLVIFLQKAPILTGLLFLVVIIVAIYYLRLKLPTQIQKPLLSTGRKSLFFLFWTVLGIVSFYLLIPAPSFFFKRMALTIIVPATLLAILCLVAITKVVFSKGSILAAPISILLILQMTGQLKLWEKTSNLGLDHYAPCEILSQIDIRRRTRIYAIPSEHLVLTYYTGLPVQSIAPVRKEFLESYDSNIVLIEKNHISIKDTDPIGYLSLMEAAKIANHHLTVSEAKKLSDQAAEQLVWEELMSAGCAMTPPQKNVQELIKNRQSEQRQLNEKRLRKWKNIIAGLAFFRGFDVQNYTDFWQVFFYRFVDPNSRRGPHLNYLNRFRIADTYVNARWMVHVSPPPN